MSRKRRLLPALALIVMVVLISACGSTSPARTATGSSGGNTTASKREKAVKFAECTRANGVRDSPTTGA
jgi:hypothetical protein